MKSIERKAAGTCIGGLPGDAPSALRLYPNFICGAEAEECRVESAVEVHFAR